MKGTVVQFSSAKGYGFIAPDDGSKDVFVHHTGILMDGYRRLVVDQVVEFDVVAGDKGPQACNVTVVEQ
jgi:CspA family cold shock protein